MDMALRDFSAEDLKYLPMCYLKNYVSPFAIQQIWDKLPESYKSNPTFKLNLPCYEHYNKGELQIDGPPPRIKSCPGCKTTINVTSVKMTAIIKGLIAVCAIVNQTLYCTTPLELNYKENLNGNLTIAAIVQKLQVVLNNGTVVNLANKWNKLPIPSAFFGFHILCILVFAIVVFITCVYKLFDISREYIKDNIEQWCILNMCSKWGRVFPATLSNHPEAIHTTKNNYDKEKKAIVPDRVHTIGNIMHIIYKPSVQTPQITLKYPNKKPINFTYEEFMKFLDFVYGFMANVEEKEDEEQVKWLDFVIGQYVFLSCCWNANDKNACSLAIQDTRNTDYVALNKNELVLFTSEKYNLYKFVYSINKGKNY
ncbi:hypothetical protein ABEB36_015065 [Hypothenemus hampei]|uniref:Uncharacterized protein n=1 Tax=Hypothenemus hampei TaxID=57062 RepID=A0ABD1E0C5_HYPHA